MTLLCFFLLSILRVSRSSIRLTGQPKSVASKESILDATTAGEAYNRYLTVYADILEGSRRTESRKRTFERNYKAIKQHNGDGSSEYRMGVNSFTLMSANEREYYLGAKRNLSEMFSVGTGVHGPIPSSNSLTPTPPSGSWRSKGYITPVKNQGRCGSCWAFAATVLLEFILTSATWHASFPPTATSLSEQLYLDCTYEEQEGKDGCDGGLSGQVFSWFNETGWGWDGESVAYRGRDRKCKYKNRPNAFSGEARIGQVRWTYESEDLKVMEHNMVTGLQEGPIINYFRIEEAFYSYSSGYYDGCVEAEEGGAPWHAVATVGYTTTAWEVKNSWGEDWGEAGYVYFRRGRNICHFPQYSLWLVGEDLNPDNNYFLAAEEEKMDEEKRVGNLCRDNSETEKHCSSLRSYGFCESPADTEFMSNNCAKTCGYCTTSGVLDCGHPAPICRVLEFITLVHSLSVSYRQQRGRHKLLRSQKSVVRQSKLLRSQKSVVRWSKGKRRH